MKKNIILAIACLAAASCGTQRIAMNTSVNGVRTILTGDKHLCRNIDVALGVRIEKRDTVMGIVVTSTEESNHGLFDKGDKLLFRFKDGSLLELSNIYDKEYQKEVRTETSSTAVHSPEYFYNPWSGMVYVSPYMTTTFIPTTRTTTTTNSYALYLIGRHQLRDIIEKGVTKVRIEDENGYLDIEGVNAGNIFSTLAGFLAEGIANDPKASAKSF